MRFLHSSDATASSVAPQHGTLCSIQSIRRHLVGQKPRKERPCCSQSSASCSPGGATTPACASFISSATANWPISASPVRTFRGSRGTQPTANARNSPKSARPERALSLLGPGPPAAPVGKQPGSRGRPRDGSETFVQPLFERLHVGQLAVFVRPVVHR